MFVSGHSDDDTLLRDPDSEVVDFVAKPATLQDDTEVLGHADLKTWGRIHRHGPVKVVDR